MSNPTELKRERMTQGHECEGCTVWHPDYWFDDITELCMDCMDDMEIEKIAREATDAIQPK